MLSLQVAVRVPDYVNKSSVSVLFSDTLGEAIYTNYGEQVLAYPVDSVADKAELSAPAPSGRMWVGFAANPVIAEVDTFAALEYYRIQFVVGDVAEEVLDTAGVFALFGSEADSTQYGLRICGESRPVPMNKGWAIAILLLLLLTTGALIMKRHLKAKQSMASIG